MATIEIQDCIVGSGVAAGLLARRLAEAGRSVVLLEDGPSELPVGASASEIDSHTFLFRGGALQATSDGGLTLLQGRCLGGAATLGGGVAEPLSEDVLDSWRDRAGWTDIALARRAGRTAMTSLQASPLPEGGHNRNNALLLEGARASGLDARSLAIAASAGPVAGFGKLGGPTSSAIEAARQAGAEIRPDHRVGRLERTGSLVAAAIGADFRVEAARFILCAGALQGADLLRRSGFRTSSLGQGLCLDHRLLVLALFDEPVGCERGGPSTVAARDRDGAFEIEGAAPGPALAMAHTRLPLADLVRFHGAWGSLAAAWCVVPGGMGRIRWDRKGRPYAERFPSPTAPAVRALGAAAGAFLAAGAREVALPVEGLPVVRGMRDLEVLRDASCAPEDLAALCLSPQGGLARGEAGPVDREFRLRGTDNLYVCDGSIFPSSAGSRPMAAILAMGELLAALLAD